ncbi:alpha/beta hydrolase [Leifsonia sp. NPDC058292]|uniref:alpha/beta hydrolase n=1 Tax=Leifsonia sp. NPDC058292 TaxID=3346428 RepID=UPI0036DC346D
MTSVVAGMTGVSVLPADIPAPTTYSVVSSTSSWAGDATDSAVGDAPAGQASGVAASGAILGSLSRLSAADLPAFLQSHRSDLDRMLVDPPKAGDMSGVWRLLDPVKQAALLKAAPHVIGNLEGIPYAVRGRANVIDLKRTIADTEDKLATGDGRAVRIELQRKLETLGNVEKALTRRDGVKRTLVSLDTSDDARASIVIGDLATAKYVSVLVPGMYMSVGEQIEDWAKTAQNLYDQQTDWLRRALGPRSGGGTPGVATVAWIGYQTPVLMNIGGMKLATEGADSLERTLEGIQSLRQADPPYLSVFAHSYGSTAALLALERGSVTVDSLALLGSPGSDAQSVSELSVRAGNVYVGQAGLDPVVHSAFFGSDPGSPSYGAKPMGVNGGVDPITGLELGGSSGHNEYFTAGTECMRNLALIGIGLGRLVMSGDADAATQDSQAASQPAPRIN